MKINRKLVGALFLSAAMLGTGCKKILDEHPSSSIVPSFFNTPTGILGGIAGAYDQIRQGTYGTEGFCAEMEAGTDEHLAGGSASGIQLYTYNGINSTLGGGGFGNAYTAINTLNGVLKFGPNVDIDAATRKQYVAQAKFLRAFWYFMLVSKYGDVPLHVEYITAPTTADTRAPAAEVYKQIIQDLNDAAADLPNQATTTPFVGKSACKSTALFLLGRVYLTRAWLTNNQADFQQAYQILTDLITNKGAYGLDLWQDYADAFNPANDYGKETIFVSDHNADTKYGLYPIGQAQGGGPYNLLPWFTTYNYPNFSGLNSYISSGSLVISGSSSIVRNVSDGRPYSRTRPNTDPVKAGANAGKRYILDQAFADRLNDSRYDNTFYTVWTANTAVTNTAGSANNTRAISYTTIPGVDTAIYMPPFEVAGAPQFIGTRPFHGIIITPKVWSSNIFPSVRKFMDPSRAAANFNDPSTRPVVIWRFADVYLLAAEAAFKLGDNGNAAKWINVVRQRAAYRKINSSAQNAAAAGAVTISPSDVTLDFILDERTREFYAEEMRWYDLVRTRQLTRRVQLWNNEAVSYVKDEYMLRPIPQSEIDLVTSGPKMPQNPGY